MSNNAYVFGPDYWAGSYGVEASGRQYVGLYFTNDFVEFTATQSASGLVLRYGVPDAPSGGGADYTLSLYTNGVSAGKLALTSRYSWLYGNYPFSNDPAQGSARHFWDELRLTNFVIEAGTTVRLQKNAGDAADFYNIDFFDLEDVPPPISQPANSLSIVLYGADPSGQTNSTTAVINCISAAFSQGKSVWAPPGSFKISGTINLPSNLTFQGAGMWHTTFFGDAAQYGDSSKRVTFSGNGFNIHLSDFAIDGKLDYRNDSEANDGLGGSFGTGSSISRVWVEHTKVGAWLINSGGLVVDGCRFRDTIADGINLAVGMRKTIVTNCTARGTGDDCFAIWPATYTTQAYVPGLNLITHCTGRLPYLANCSAIYGGTNNAIEDCSFVDACYASGTLISTTFPVGANVFSGITIVKRSVIERCGSKDPNGDPRAALLLYLDNASISGINISQVLITNSLYDGLDVLAPGSSTSSGVGTLSNAVLSQVDIPNYGLGYYGSDALGADYDAIGSMTVSNSAIVEFINLSGNFVFNFTHPPASTLKDLTVVPDYGYVYFVATTFPGYAYQMEVSTNLGSTNWSPVYDVPLTAYSTETYFYDALAADPAKFYRLSSP